MIIVIDFENVAGRLGFLLISFMVQLALEGCVLFFLESHLLFRVS